MSRHGPEKQKSGYRLDVRDIALRGGDSGEAAIVPHDAKRSPLIRFVSGEDEELLMPPKKSTAPRLTPEEVATLRAWIDAGPAWPDELAGPKNAGPPHWAWQPLVKPSVPAGAENPIDAFIHAKLAAKQLESSPEADRPTLIRRLTFDLHGLPPAPEEVDAFVTDNEPQAYERLVDRLLASPRYGERWARHWLDVAHYGESDGFGMDRPRMAAWPYRDYVIASLNADKPYARFVQEQLAADALFPDEAALTPALGFAAAGPFNQSALVEQVDDTLCKRIALNLDRDDMVASTASTFVSLTVHCARCHDHKFNPITQLDYYRLQAVFAGVGRAERLFDADPALRARRAELRKRKAALETSAEADPPSAEELAALQAAQPAREKSLTALVARWSPVESAELSSKSGNGFTALPDSS